MFGKYPVNRVVAFLDGSNIYSAFSECFGSSKYDQKMLCHELAGPGRVLVQYRFYAAPLPEGESDGQKARYDAQATFFRALRAQSLSVLRLGRFRIKEAGKLEEKGVDVLMAIDMVVGAARDQYDTAIVLSADEDLVPAVEAVRDEFRKRVELALPRETKAYHLRHAVDGVQEITREMFERVKL